MQVNDEPEIAIVPFQALPMLFTPDPAPMAIAVPIVPPGYLCM